MNHKVETNRNKQNNLFMTLEIGEFFIYNGDLFMKSKLSEAICFARGSDSVFEQECCFRLSSPTNVEKVNVKIVVEE